ncbi:DUF2513 domain-containing protein [uncultured Anaerovibrio sp.]|uniref:DUF2513 domain-containing protein n=1 Tax=uncultured Anaerovibrio sp. TaxID=361586 RepID=UPI00260343A1|nr:DUF2513 domain-containing protein [uncultured Anaerovibrio sp.]
MKLNYELLRDLLLIIEEESDGHKAFVYGHYVNSCPSYHPDQVEYHIKYLLDSQLIEGEHWRYVIDITPTGRDYLNSIRNDSVWQKVKTQIQPLGPIALDLVAEVGKSFISKQLGL